MICSFSEQWTFSVWSTAWLSTLGDLKYGSLQESFCPLQSAFPRSLQEGMYSLWVYIYAYQIKKINYLSLSLQPVHSGSSFFALEICLNACYWLYLNSHIKPWITVLLMVRVGCCLGACQKETCSEMLIDQ